MEDPRYKGSELKEIFSTPGTCSHCGNDGKPELVGYKGKLDGKYYDLECKEVESLLAPVEAQPEPFVESAPTMSRRRPR